MDAIVKRDELKKTLAHLLDIHKYSGAYTEVKENVDTYRSNSDIMKKYLEYLDNIYFKKIDREEEKRLRLIIIRIMSMMYGKRLK